MICMKIVKSYNPETWDCVFFEEGNYTKPIMILGDYKLKEFYEKMNNDKQEAKWKGCL